MANKGKGSEAKRQRQKALKRQRRKQQRTVKAQDKRARDETAAIPRAISPGELEAAYVKPGPGDGLADTAAGKAGSDTENTGGRRRLKLREIVAAYRKREREAKKAAAAEKRAARKADRTRSASTLDEDSIRGKKWKAKLQTYIRVNHSQNGAAASALEADGVLQRWIRYQQKQYARNKLADWQIKALEQAGFAWEQPFSGNRPKWNTRLEAIKAIVQTADGSYAWEGLSGNLGHLQWLVRQQTMHAQGKLSPARAEALRALGFDLEGGFRAMIKRRNWERHFRDYQALRGKDGRHAPFSSSPNKHLPQWAAQQRSHAAKGTMDPVLKKRLEQAGFVWDVSQSASHAWWHYLKQLEAYKKAHGHTQVPQNHADNPTLGRWIARQRLLLRQGQLLPEQVQALEGLGFSKQALKISVPHWERMCAKLALVCQKHHGGKIPPGEGLTQEFTTWLFWQRRKHRLGKLMDWQIHRLEALGVYWDSAEAYEAHWRLTLDKLIAFKQQHGHTRVPAGHHDPHLALWVQNQRDKFRRGELKDTRVHALREIGFIFDTRTLPRPEWMRHYNNLKAYHAKHGHARVPRMYPPDQSLAEWVAQQKQRGKQGKLKDFHIELLDALDFPWTRRPPTNSA